jgi:type VI protein secretion system component VasK
MIRTSGRPDYVRNFQVGVAQLVILFYGVLLIPVLFSGYELLFGDGGAGSAGRARWAVWGIAFVPLTAAVVAAVKLFRTRADRRRSSRLAAWAAGLFAVGVGMIITEAIITSH